MEQRKGRRLILFPVPFQGHINPMLELANILHLKGFSITIIHTNFNSLNPSSHPHFTFHSIPDGLSESEASSKDILFLISVLTAKCVEPFRECLASLLSDVSEDPVACLISDAIFHFAQSVADSLKVPRVVLRTGGASSFTVFAAFPLLREKGYFPIPDSRLEEPVAEFPHLKVKDLPVIKGCDSEEYFQLADGMSNGTKSSRGLIFNTFEDLEEQALGKIRQEFPIPIFPIGPFHNCFPAASSSLPLATEDKSCISWLNGQAPKSVVYVSYGSIVAIKEAQFLEIAWGLANSKQPFLWVIRPDSIHGGSQWLELLPNEFLENLNGRGHIVKWSPQKEVLSHAAIGVFWTHSGWNSTLESICEGVPMICMPCFTDQMVNARYVSNVWKVGLQLEPGAERGEIERTIRKLMVEKEGEEIRARSLKLMEKANLCFKQDGSSYQSLDGLVKHILSLESFVFRTQ
ncbi:putative cytokinin 7-beta-glucosyltransferase [Rosa chinensis]|uniref:Putative cytokinin 7-beta-glucosyltransferase n=1 Tax=Rosa chinensis TaxID=74649 RepID=A0A2P6SKW1_ROSCH|nr:UDP-glycosyltransferase 76F1 [Rosa chinensis]PRQ59325.1 putative cytokinin 7-beta-glucosyltransferase [Rosa chinensis]